MNDNNKLFVIEAGDVLDVMPPEKKRRETVHVENVPPPPRTQRRFAPAVQPLTAATKSVPTPTPRRRKPAQPSRRPLHIAQLTVLSYVLGPLALLLTPQGRSGRGWLTLAGVAAGAAVLLLVAGFGGLVRDTQPASAWLWLGLVVLATGAGCAAWARAIHLVGGAGIPPRVKQPHWLRHRAVVALLGLVAPGSGQLLAGRRGRAALTALLAWPVAAAALVAIHAGGLWVHHREAAWLEASGPALEMALVAAAACVALGFLGHVAQALEGMRLAGGEPGLKARFRGDYYAVAVLALVVGLAVGVQPDRMAGQLDQGGDALRSEGLQWVPLQLSLVASHLDPAKVEYSLQAMDLYAALGDRDKAAAMRADLDANLGTYVALVQREAVQEFGLARAEAPRSVPRAATVAPPVAVQPADVVPQDAPQNVPQETPQAAPSRTPVPIGAEVMHFMGSMMSVRESAPDTAPPAR